MIVGHSRKQILVSPAFSFYSLNKVRHQPCALSFMFFGRDGAKALPEQREKKGNVVNKHGDSIEILQFRR